MRYNNRKFGASRKPKVFYIDSNMLINTSYTVLNKTSAICVTTISSYVDDCVTVNTTFRDFPCDLGFYPTIYLLNTINEPEYNIYIYKLDVDFYNRSDIVDKEPGTEKTYLNIDDDVIYLVNHYLFRVRNEDMFSEEDDYDESDEDSYDDDNYEED